MFAKFDDGRTYYQDEFGRTEKQREFLKKKPPILTLKPRDVCGCGSGLLFKECCESKPAALRPTWDERSIRERNIMFYNAVVKVLDLTPGKDWIQVRRDLTDEQIKKIYALYEGLWPLETDILQLLPKPDGTARAIYTGAIHPTTIAKFAPGAALYFGEIIIQHPFLHAGTVKKKYSPVENPKTFRKEFLKSLLFFLNVMPLVEIGLVNLVPDPCNFDSHLRDQMLHMAQSRAAGTSVDKNTEPYFNELMMEDFQRNVLSLPKDQLLSQVSRFSPELDKEKQEEAMKYIEFLKERDPLAVLQTDSLAGGQFVMMSLAPNFEISMYLAQATGSSIVTDSIFRWNEIKRASYRRTRNGRANLTYLANGIENSEFLFPQNVMDIETLALNQTFSVYPTLMRDVFKYLSKISERGFKPNREAQLYARFSRAHIKLQSAIEKTGLVAKRGRISCLFPPEGIQNNTVNRLLLMSSSEMHLPNVPMAFFIEDPALVSKSKSILDR